MLEVGEVEHLEVESRDPGVLPLRKHIEHLADQPTRAVLPQLVWLPADCSGPATELISLVASTTHNHSSRVAHRRRVSADCFARRGDSPALLPVPWQRSKGY